MRQRLEWFFYKPRNFRSYQKLELARKKSPLEPLGEMWPCHLFDVRLHASRTVRQIFFCCFKPPNLLLFVMADLGNNIAALCQFIAFFCHFVNPSNPTDTYANKYTCFMYSLHVALVDKNTVSGTSRLGAWFCHWFTMRLYELYFFLQASFCFCIMSWLSFWVLLTQWLWAYGSLSLSILSIWVYVLEEVYSWSGAHVPHWTRVEYWEFWVGG